MDKCQKFLEALSDGSYDNMNAGDREKFENQLKKDAGCKKEFEKMKKTLDILKENKTPDPGAEYWDSFYDRVESKLGSSQTKRNYWPVLLQAAAFIIGGIFIGYMLFNKPASEAITSHISNADIKQAALNEETANMLEESKVLLLGIANFSDLRNSNEKIDFSFQKEKSSTLLLQTADLKKKLAKSKNRRVISLINDLELILMQIANLEDEFDLPAIEMIRDGANKQSLLFKINMENLLIEARKEQPQNTNNTKEI
ncbi:MAG: hypothetical protein D8M58_16015 [Calditrichaeota bacterium]|nr:MAG: hypothetical protein DWQ03_07745 [Calditrichota bacterium]MBL1206911.1 hypothetical protein [Calditrichota bacterium]NOG46737.1 hypothetical protein [Calditrichota bacterium]